MLPTVGRQRTSRKQRTCRTVSVVVFVCCGCGCCGRAAASSWRRGNGNAHLRRRTHRAAAGAPREKRSSCSPRRRRTARRIERLLVQHCVVPLSEFYERVSKVAAVCVESSIRRPKSNRPKTATTATARTFMT
jgi:hypothetical protein